MFCAEDIVAFWSKVNKADTCWEWSGKTKPDGYVQTRVAGKLKYIHRIAWEITFGPIPRGMMVLHKCDNRMCCRPDHLFLGTHQDNMNDMVAKGRASGVVDPTVKPRGEENGFSKLVADDVLKIRSLSASGVPASKIAVQFNVHRNNIYHVVHRRTWAHIH